MCALPRGLWLRPKNPPQDANLIRIDMSKTSINLQPCKQSSELHNKRLKTLDYVRPDLSQKNEWWSAVPSLGELRSEISKIVKAKTGRKMQAKAEPLREGVVVIQDCTTMEQLKELGRRLQERFGVTPVQIAIHRDEGHYDKGTGEWKPNLHAHIVFDWYDHSTGKSIKTTKLDAVEMQTITAETLGMERGVSSDKKHKSARQFKAEAQARELDEKVRETKAELAELSEVKAAKEAAIDAAKEKVQDFFTGKSKAKEKEMKAEIQRLTAELAQKDKEIGRMEENAIAAENRAKNDISVAWKHAREEIGHLKSEKEELKSMATTWQMIALDLWPEMLEAIKAIVERCTTTIRHFTDAGVEAIEKALARFRNREVAGEKLWGFAEKFFPENTYPEWIRDGKEEYDSIVNREQQHSQTIKR